MLEIPSIEHNGKRDDSEKVSSRNFFKDCSTISKLTGLFTALTTEAFSFRRSVDFVHVSGDETSF